MPTLQVENVKDILEIAQRVSFKFGNISRYLGATATGSPSGHCDAIKSIHNTNTILGVIC